MALIILMGQPVTVPPTESGVPGRSDEVEIRLMRPGAEIEVSQLVEYSFREAVAPLYPPEGVAEFLRFATPEAIRERGQRDCHVLVAWADEEMFGIVEVRDHRHIQMLFVRPDQQKRGIGRKLLRGAIDHCQEGNPELDEVTVHSSPNAVAAYSRMGFVAAGPETETDGIRFTPMKLLLPHRDSFGGVLD